MKKIIQYLCVVLVASVLTACEKTPSVRTAGKQLDQATTKAEFEIKNVSKKTESALDDTSITTKARAALIEEPHLKSFQINLSTVKGIVTIHGSVDDEKEKKRVNDIVSAVAGVKGTKNNLVVKSK